MKQEVINFLSKRRVRIIGLFPTALYTYFSVHFFIFLLKSTIFRPPNQVFYMGDLIGVIGFCLFCGILGAIGILAIVTAYFMKGIFRILYLSGALQVIFAILFLPMSLHFNAEYIDFAPHISGSEIVIGKWMNDYYILELFPDSTYTLIVDPNMRWSDKQEIHNGTWYLNWNTLYLSHLADKRQDYWEVRVSDSYYFITYSIPENPDHWLGNLGLMRESDWHATH